MENVPVTPEIKAHLWDALETLASSPIEQRTLLSLTVFLQDRNLRQAIAPFTTKGPYGRLLDNNFDNLKHGRWACFEMETLMETPAVIAPVLSYLFHRLEQRFSGAPTLLVLDEAWLFLDHPTFAGRIRAWLKTLRKKNVSVIFATQSLVDVDSSSIAATLKEACFTKLFLPNAAALQPDASAFYKRFGLNDRQVQIVAEATPKQDYYYTSPLGSRLFSLRLGRAALAYCAGISAENVNLIRSLRRDGRATSDFNRLYQEAKGIKQSSPINESEKEAA
jgi:type IV secretion system protein VirB4